jgi:hypothetical protein
MDDMWINDRAADALYHACWEFVRKAECGEAVGGDSYAQMKAALRMVDGEPVPAPSNEEPQCNHEIYDDTGSCITCGAPMNLVSHDQEHTSICSHLGRIDRTLAEKAESIITLTKLFQGDHDRITELDERLIGEERRATEQYLLVESQKAAIAEQGRRITDLETTSADWMKEIDERLEGNRVNIKMLMQDLIERKECLETPAPTPGLSVADVRAEIERKIKVSECNVCKIDLAELRCFIDDSAPAAVDWKARWTELKDRLTRGGLPVSVEIMRKIESEAPR